MRKLDGATDEHEEPYALVDARARTIASARNRLAVDVLHREPRPPGGVAARVDESGDVRVIHECEDLPLSQRACERDRQVGPHEFQRHSLAHFVEAFGEKNFAHTASAEKADQLEPIGDNRAGDVSRLDRVRLALFVGLRKQAPQRRRKLGVGMCQCVEGFVARARRLVEEPMELVANPASKMKQRFVHLALDVLAEPESRERPVAIDRTFVDVEHLRHGRHAESDEVAELDDAREPLVDLFARRLVRARRLPRRVTRGQSSRGSAAASRRRGLLVSTRPRVSPRARAARGRRGSAASCDLRR